jgi:hypothetical protein
LTPSPDRLEQRTGIDCSYSEMSRFVFRAVLFALALAGLAGCGGGKAPVATGAACLAELDEHGVVYRSLDMGEPKDDRCRIATAVRVSQIGVPLSRPAAMSCVLANRLDEFERGVMQKLAMDDLGHRVVRIDHLGAYSCRANTGKHGQLSEHAYGLAIDISGFRLSDGTTVNVEHDWSHPGPKRDFLLHLAKSACGYFSVVLTPDSNADHYNHMHFDLGPERLCSV